MASAARFVIPPRAPSALKIVGEELLFPVRRVYCVGRNYRAHAVEMEARQKAMKISAGDQVEAPPFFFQKPAHGAIVDASSGGNARVAYPPKTAALEFELELVVALKKGGRGVAVADAADLIFGCALGVDLTRRDLQNAAKQARRPWDAAKGFDDSAPCGALLRGPPPGSDAVLELRTNGEVRQTCSVGDMIYGVPEIIHHLSREVTLEAGDVIFTGTPAGVGPVVPGDAVLCEATAADGSEALPVCAFVVGEVAAGASEAAPDRAPLVPASDPVTSFRDERFAWHGGAPEHTIDEGGIAITPTAGLDYWSRTFYSPVLRKHDAQTLLAPVAADAEATLTTAFTLAPRAQFDQAGIMVLVDDDTWVKAGIEYTDGAPRLSCVVTNDGYSDWSTQRWDDWDDQETTSVRVRVSKLLPGTPQGPALVFEAAPWVAGAPVDAPADWVQIRIASLRSGAKPWRMGLFAISPIEAAGCTARFHHVVLGAKEEPVHGGDSGVS